jgi:MFS family permease
VLLARKMSNEEEKINYMNDHHKSFLVKAVIIVGGGGLIFGYDIGVISGTLPTITDQFNLSPYEEGLVVSILYAGSIIGSIFGGPICDAIGRWKTIQLQNVIFIIGALITGLATNLSALCVGRFFVGVASAISGLADVPYLTEIARPEYRGILSGQYEILVGAGILLSFCLDLAFISFHNGWRWAFLLPGIFALAQSAGLLLLPESPRWLISKGRHDEAVRASQFIYGDSFPEDLLYDKKTKPNTDASSSQEQALDPNSSHPMTVTSALHSYPVYSNDDNDNEEHKNQLETSNSVENSNNNNNNRNKNDGFTSPTMETSTRESRDSTSTGATITDLFLKEKELLTAFQYPIFVIVMIQILSQITGCNVIRNYAPTIFEDAGVSDGMALFYNILLGIVKLIFTIISVLYIEKSGRKRFYLLGVGIIIFGMGFLTVASIASPGGNLSSPAVFVIGCAFIYAGFGFSYGPVPWILSSEMVPSLIRGRVLCISLIASNLTQLVMNFLFFPMVEGLTVAGTFGIFLLLNIIAFYYGLHFLVETREISPEIILKDLKQKLESFRQLTVTDLCCCLTAWKDCCTKRRSYAELCMD